MNCQCTHTVFNHHPKMEREGAVRFTLGACAVEGCGCTKYVVAGAKSDKIDPAITRDIRSLERDVRQIQLRLQELKTRTASRE
jgi:hypothetical protein